MTVKFNISSPDNQLIEKARKVKKAYLNNFETDNSQRIKAINFMAEALSCNMDKILEANQNDLKIADSNGISKSLLSRLKLSREKLILGIDGVRQVGQLKDPTGELQVNRELSNGLILVRKTVPIGVIGVIFESRPDAVMQISSLAIRSGNGVILKGGSEANYTNIAIVEALKDGLKNSEINEDSICLLTSRKDSMAMLNLDKDINLIIPRGSNELVKFIKENTKIPVLGHADGICHIYIDNEADIDIAIKVSLDSKIQYPAACNAIETLLIHQDIAKDFLNKAIPIFKTNNVELRGDKIAQSYGVEFSANNEDWKTEYLDKILSIKIVDTLDDAILHIEEFGSKHTDGIISQNQNNASKFMNLVNSSGVFHNCSTRFADGFRYGFGAEVGISTQSLPPRGPVGLEGLVTYKYFLNGEGQVVEDFSSGRKIFTHRDL
tara:strand:+ start:4041 stop:5351 length:1311 start_codon:yes stop_codon:yes gene_type:complete